MDITKIKEEIARDEEGRTFTPYDKEGNPYLGADGNPATITVVGSDSKRVRAVKDAQTRRLLRRQRTRLEPSDLRANRIEIAAAAVIAWTGWEANDKPWPCTPENVAALLEADHILVQTEEEIDRPRNFSSSSAEISSSSSDTRRDSRSPRKTDALSPSI
jgi:hypothetical protein